MSLLFFMGLHAVALAMAVVCLFGARPSIHASAVLVLLIDLGGFAVSQGVITDGFPPADLIWAVMGPLFLPGLVLFEALPAAPLLTMLALIAAIGGGLWIWRLLSRAGARLRMLAAGVGGSLVAIATLEVAVEATMRIDAARISGGCGYWRASTIQMLTSGASSHGGAHGGLTDGRATYSWSFREGGWMPARTCPLTDTLGCSCPE